MRFKELCAPAEKKKPYRANIASPTAHSSKRLTCTQADQEAYVLYIQVSRKDFSNGLSKNYRKHSHSDRGYNRSLKYWLHRQLSPLDSWRVIICLPMAGHHKKPAHLLIKKKGENFSKTRVARYAVIINNKLKYKFFIYAYIMTSR